MAKKITIRGFIGWDENATPEFLARELAAAKGDEIDLEFSSGGGYVFAGLEMANMVRNYSGRIVARVTGLAASMSSYIPMMADEMIVEDNAVFMIHNVSTIAWGDFRDLEKAAAHIKGLRDILAKAYVAKTGKSIEEIQALMDDESFFYGDEIVEAGFADSVIQVAVDGDDKDTAVILAKEEIASIVGKMKEDETAVKDDWHKAAAYFEVKTPTAATQPPASAGTTPQEATKMDLKAFLAANPDAQAEIDVMISSAKAEGKAEGVTEGKTVMNEAFAAASPILSSASYPQTVKDRVLAKAQAGDIAGLQDFVALHDMKTEANNDEEANDEQEEETNPTPPETGAGDGTVNSAADLAGAVAQHKAEYGTPQKGDK